MTTKEQPEDLRTTIINTIELFKLAEQHGKTPWSPVDEILRLCEAAALAALPDRPEQVPGNKLPYINRGYIEGEVNGAIKTITAAQANIHSVFGGAGE